MDTDPWTWNASNVQQFFRQDAIALIADRPSGQLPPLNAFVQALSENDVEGASLLDSVDIAALRQEFGISSYRHRGAIMHCIHKLRNLSQSYQSRNISLAPQTPRSMVATPLLPPVPAGSATALPSTEAVGENTREGEVHVEDAHGRKRRKLNLTATEAGPQPSRAHKISEDASSYLPDAALPLDELFYGPTGLGHVIGELNPDGSVLVDHDDPDTADDNFQVTSQHKRDGEVHFVHSRLQYFLRNAEQVGLRRKDRDAVAILPYRDGQQLKARSATVIQAGQNGDYVAIKEQASLLQSGLDYSGQTQESTGEWDWVLQKHKQKAGEDEISVWADSENGDDIGTVATTDGDEGKGQEADEEDDEDTITKPRIEELVDAEIEKCIVKWHSKVPALEEKRAWSIWKKTRRSRVHRDMLVEGAQALIADFTRRLAKLREDFLDREYSSEQVVQRACLNLEPTIEDREEENWKISVWLRRDEPAHTVFHRAKQTTGTLQTPATAKATPGFVLHPDDRLSVSPTPATHLNAVIGAAATTSDDDRDEYHTPNGSATGSPAPENDGFEASDEMSLDDDHNEQELAEEDEFVHEDASSPPRRTSADGLSEQQLSDQNEIPEEDEQEEETPPKRRECPICYMPQTPDKYAFARHVDDCLSKKAIENDKWESESDNELPPASTFVSQKIKRLSDTPAKPVEAGPSRAATQPIDLTISSDSPGAASSPAPSKRKRKAPPKKNVVLNGNPELATSAEVDSWDLADLSRSADRNRIVIKIIREMSPEQQKALHQCLQSFPSRSNRIDQVQAAARAHETGTTADAGLKEEYFDQMMHCARIAAAWWVSDPKCYFETDDTNAPWAALYSDKGQVGIFLDKLLSLLKMRDSKLFSGPKAKHSNAATKTSDVTIISDSGEERDPHHTPRKQRQKPVKESQSAKKSRTAALAREAQYTQHLESQTTNSSKLAAMIASDTSNSEIDINPVRAEEHEPIFIYPKIAKKMKPHQIDGVRFMWREITASGDDGNQGCLLAHTMGLGKTMQTITLLVAVVEASESRIPAVRKQLPAHLRPKGIRGTRQLRIMVLCPPSLLQNWQREIDQWAPGKIGHVFMVEASSKTQQMALMEDWYRVGGVLLIGYQMFRSLVNRKEGKVRKEVGSRLDEMLLEGPEVVVADEAHNLKSPKAGISQAATAIKTHTRIALTGTPMSNDLQEIYALVSWIAPGYLGEPREFRANFAEPIQQGTYEDSSRHEQRKGIKKLAVLHQQIQPKVSRADITALRGSLKPKVEFVITVPLTELQEVVYKKYLVALLGGGRNAEASNTRIFDWLAVLGLLTNHPSAFRRKLLTKPAPKKGKKAAIREMTPSDDGSNATTAVEAETTVGQLLEGEMEGGDNFGDQDVYSMGFTEGMVQEILRDVDEDVDPTLSAKASIFLDILELCRKCGDKILVFSHRLPTLQYFSDLLDAHKVQFGHIDGTVPMTKRMQILEDFHKGKFDVMLISTKAGGVGLNIQGANRVIMIDFSFNPAHEEQAIGRAYRLGQTKPVFVYRFVAGGTFEAAIWNTQLFKTSLTNRVVDKKNTKRSAQKGREYLHHPRPVEQEDLSKWIRMGKDPLVLDKILARQETGESDVMIRKISTTETLQEIVEEDPLDEEERKEVDEEINQGKTRIRGRKAGAAQDGYLAAKGSMAPVYPPASAQALRTQVYAPRPSAGQATPARFMPSTAPAAAAGPQSPMGGLPIYRPSPLGQQRSHGHPTR
ncbi:hypothetical protein LTR36_009409 [Oleoguttula mirabilis]|uniref:Uncharacterized protein n=1 Tax=Oleoguttula mirabilis TaxID=1507867 RepID=A0AAV9JT94_9PEZI|nr:hypothetical protein LTR36_009409 [Oleoguttula mirabilis]